MLARRAAEQAADGCADAVDQDLDRAQSVLASAQAKPEGFFLGWSTERLAGYRGCCAVLLNAEDAAIPLERAVAATKPAMLSQRSAVLIDLATAWSWVPSGGCRSGPCVARAPESPRSSLRRDAPTRCPPAGGGPGCGGGREAWR